jgi:hypothetical protein
MILNGLFAILVAGTPASAMCQTTQQASPKENGVSSSPGNSGKAGPTSPTVSSSPENPGKKGRLDYEHARPFPLPSIDCAPSQHEGRDGKEIR